MKNWNLLRWSSWQSIALLSLLTSLMTLSVMAIDIVDFDTEEQRGRYKNLVAELRCLVCQNQSLADSNATLAEDMRGVVADMIRDDLADAAIIQFMTDRYGNFVHYRPSLSGKTLMLWVLPFLMILIAFIWLPSIIRSHRFIPLNEADRESVAQILDKK